MNNSIEEGEGCGVFWGAEGWSGGGRGRGGGVEWGGGGRGGVCGLNVLL